MGTSRERLGSGTPWASLGPAGPAAGEGGGLSWGWGLKKKVCRPRSPPFLTPSRPPPRISEEERPCQKLHVVPGSTEPVSVLL